MHLRALGGTVLFAFLSLAEPVLARCLLRQIAKGSLPVEQITASDSLATWAVSRLQRNSDGVMKYTACVQMLTILAWS
jgi:hypothetical protein